MTDQQQKPIVIIGATGKTGRRVASGLAARNIPLRTAARSTTPAFDWTQPDQWDQVLAGAGSAYITYHPDLALPQAEEAIRQLVDCARRQQVNHLVLLSGRGEEGAQRAEQVIIDSGLSWNVVRASWFMQNFSESFMAEGIMNGELILPAGDVREPFTDADDIAAVAIAALTRPELRNRVFEVTGPELLTFADCVAEISRQSGRPVRYTQVPLADWLQVLQQQGASGDLLWLLNELFSNVLDGRNASTAQGVRDALGRDATSFADYVSRTLAAEIWPQACHA